VLFQSKGFVTIERMGQPMFLVAVSGFIGGVALHSFFDVGAAFSLFVVFLGISLFVYYRLKKRQHPGQDFKVTLLLSVSFICFGLGLIRYDISLIDRESALTRRIGENVELSGIVVEEPQDRENMQRLVVEIEEAETKALVWTTFYPRFEYGDRISVSGILKEPQNFESENGRTFDYRSYLAKDGIYFEFMRPELEPVSKDHGSVIKKYLFGFKHAFVENFKESIPEPSSSLLAGLLVGEKSSLGKDLENDLRTVGLIHMVVLSGYNITLIADFIMKIFAFLPRALGHTFGIISIILFALMTGGSATVVRATIMALLAVAARSSARIYDVARALIIAGTVMVIHNPKILIFDPSFQLSFMATLGLIILSPKVETRLQWIPAKYKLREIATATIATQIFVLPLLLYMTGMFSLISLPANILVLIAVPYAMLLGFFAGALGFVSFVASLPFAYVAYALLAYQLTLVEFFASLPFASIAIPYFPAWLMVGVYLCGVVFVWWRNRRRVPTVPDNIIYLPE